MGFRNLDVIAFGRVRPRARRHRERGLTGPESLEGRALMSAGLKTATAHAAQPKSRSVDVSIPTAPPNPPTIGGIRAHMNLVYTTIGGQPEHLDLYTPTGPPPAGGWPVVLALPGGGWRWVRRNDLGQTVSELAKYGYVVAVADYAYSSGAPGSHIWPTDFEDVRQAVRWLKTNAAKLKINPGKVAVWGESAGGHLADLLGTDPDAPLTDIHGQPTGGTAPGQVSAAVQAVIDFYGPTDLTTLYSESPNAQPYLTTFIGGTPGRSTLRNTRTPRRWPMFRPIRRRF